MHSNVMNIFFTPIEKNLDWQIFQLDCCRNIFPVTKPDKGLKWTVRHANIKFASRMSFVETAQGLINVLAYKNS
jgi:hypothetical protein